MIEIAKTMLPEEPAKPAQAARPKGFSVRVDEYDVHWDCPEAGHGVFGMHCYTPSCFSPGPRSPISPTDFRKFASIFNQIADALEAEEKKPDVANS